MATQDYVLNGTTTFTFPFAVRSASLLTLELVPGGVVSTGDYTVTGAGPTSTGVTVTYPDAPTSTTTVLRITRYVQPDRITTLNGPSDITVANLNAEFDNAYDAIADFQISGVNVAQAVVDAQAAAAAAEAAAAGVSLPSIVGGDTGKILRVNGAETGYELTAALLDSEVTTAKINDGAVTTAKINDGAVTAAKLASGIRAAQQIAQASVAGGASEDLPSVFADNPYDFYMVVLSNVVTSGTSTGLQLQVTDDSGVSYETTGYSGGAAGYSLTTSNVNAGSEVVNSIVKFQAFGNVGSGQTYIADITQMTLSLTSGAELASVLSEYAGATPPTGFRILSKDGTTLAAQGSVTVYGSDMPF